MLLNSSDLRLCLLDIVCVAVVEDFQVKICIQKNVKLKKQLQ